MHAIDPETDGCLAVRHVDPRVAKQLLVIPLACGFVRKIEGEPRVASGEWSSDANSMAISRTLPGPCASRYSVGQEKLTRLTSSSTRVRVRQGRRDW